MISGIIGLLSLLKISIVEVSLQNQSLKCAPINYINTTQKQLIT
jgi:hypothetical protein